MFRNHGCRTFTLVGCAIFLALNLSNHAYADQDHHENSEHSEHSEHSDKPDTSSGDGGDNGGDPAGKPDSSSLDPLQSSGRAAVSGIERTANQDEALSAITTGKAVSLPLLLAFMANKFPGEIVDIKLKNKEGQYHYEVEYLTSAAKLRVIALNAKTLGKL